MARSKKRSEKRKERKRTGSKRRDSVVQSGGKTTFRIPDGVELFVPKDKSYRFDIILYQVGQGNPCADPKEWYYERTYYVHKNIGPNNEWVVCPAKTAGKACPVCEERARMVRDPECDEDNIKALKPSQRQLWLLNMRGDEEGLRLFDFSNWFFGKMLDEIRSDADEDETHISDFDDPEAGALMKVKFRDDPPYGVKASTMEFRPRPDGIDDSILEHGICLDDLLIIPKYVVLKNLFLQIDPEDDDEPEDKPKTKKGKKSKKEKGPVASDYGIEVGDKVKDEDDDVYTVVKISGDGTSLTCEDEDGDTIPLGPAEVTKIEEKKKSKKDKTKKDKKSKKKEPEPEEDDEDDVPFDEDDDEEEDEDESDLDEDWDDFEDDDEDDDED